VTQHYLTDERLMIQAVAWQFTAARSIGLARGALEIFEGTSEIQLRIISDRMLGKPTHRGGS